MSDNSNKKLRILLATGIFPPDIGGPATFAKTLQEELLKHEIEVKIVTYGESENSPRIFYISRRQNILLRYLKCFLYIWKMSSDIDVVYSFDLISVGLPCAIVKIFKPKINFVIRLGGDRQWEEAVEAGGYRDTLRSYYKEKKFSIKEKIFYKLSNFVLKRADYIIFNANIIKDIFLLHRRLKKEKAQVIKNFQPMIDFDKLQKEDKSKLIILYIGRLVAFKNLLNLIKSFELILDKLPDNVYLEIIGEGPEKAKLIDYINKKNINFRVSILPKLAHSEAMQRIYNNDIFIVPSLTEVNAHTVSEALALNKLVILSTESESNFIGEKSANLIYVNPLDEQAIAEKMLEAVDIIINNKQGPSILNKKYDINWDRETIIKKHLDIFYRLVKYEKAG